MKKLLFGLIAFLFFSQYSNAQSSNNTSKTKLFCVTVSCCGIGPFGIEIWSEKTCHYVYTTNRSIVYSFNTNNTLNSVNVKEDVILAGQFDENGQNLVLPAGDYPVKENSIEFTPSPYAAKKYCYKREVSGTILGHEYNYSIDICISFGKSNKGVVEIKPAFNAELTAKILESEDKIFEIKNDVQFKEDGLNYVLKAGKYILNENGTAYQQNVIVK